MSQTAVGRLPAALWIPGGLVLGALAAGASLTFGTLGSPGSAGDYGQAVVWEQRWPRTLTGLAVGAALGAAGGLMQALTRNPLADPSVLGVNAGAAFALVTVLSFWPLGDPQSQLVVALAGAAAAACLVWTLGSGGTKGASGASLALAGVVLTALLNAWNSALLLQNHQTLDTVRSWMAGSLSGRSMETLASLAPWLGAGLLATLALGRYLDLWGLGPDAARSLGVRIGLVRNLTLGLVVGLSAVAVALAGPVGFVGLAVPHLARALVGPHQTDILGASMLLGPLLLLGADVAGRVVLPPNEIPVGIVTALMGAPLLVVLAVSRGRR